MIRFFISQETQTKADHQQIVLRLKCRYEQQYNYYELSSYYNKHKRKFPFVKNTKILELNKDIKNDLFHYDY